MLPRAESLSGRARTVREIPHRIASPRGLFKRACRDSARNSLPGCFPARSPQAGVPGQCAEFPTGALPRAESPSGHAGTVRGSPRRDAFLCGIFKRAFPDNVRNSLSGRFPARVLQAGVPGQCAEFPAGALPRARSSSGRAGTVRGIPRRGASGGWGCNWARKGA